MATIRERVRKDGTASFQVRWLQGGRGGTWEAERFEDPEQADTFRKLVDAHKQQWPYGWVPGQGFVEPEQDPDDVPLTDWARRYVDRLTGIDPRTRDDYRREVDRHISLMVHTTRSGLVMPATIGNITADDVQDWVRLQEAGQPDAKPGQWVRRPASPKSTANRHGLLWCIVQAAIDADPPLRTKNCCANTRLPRVDYGTSEEMVFLEQEEYQLLRKHLTDPAARDLADWLIGTGMRWGEATALQVQDLRLGGPRPTVNVQRAWKRSPRGAQTSFFLGPPKTRKARRLVALAPTQVDLARRLKQGMPPEAFLFRTPTGKAWRHSNFYNRKWIPAVAAAMETGLPRRPRIHDLRHSHVAWLVAANIPLPAIQARLGHESIQTTIDRYGHLARSLDSDISAAVQAAMGSRPPSDHGLRLVSA
ncbi:site-specific integrase [Streptomyces sp. NBC_00102]|uniref:tyrosine-type recombinase/integrase n=1 Tax=Streptomyces sp. NBC_00102 TaxID=2975652 RepID=UPI002259AA87|nr:site-specific integrase [Streptomyces sp. NBC_00102]MCX5397175.1 site-specific integrase [Streptomyces sp. NBC_00102]